MALWRIKREAEVVKETPLSRLEKEFGQLCRARFGIREGRLKEKKKKQLIKAEFVRFITHPLVDEVRINLADSARAVLLLTHPVIIPHGGYTYVLGQYEVRLGHRKDIESGARFMELKCLNLTNKRGEYHGPHISAHGDLCSEARLDIQEAYFSGRVGTAMAYVLDALGTYTEGRSYPCAKIDRWPKLQQEGEAS